ncbi:regulatory protein NPR3-like [Tripterygium wilfordii]|uniref:Regulatory protein NPR3-like n=1 Tax=Tripterygium wilfordii TaxID=458696 RepID=A0A7J7DCR5_TRIWF|nr:BTB/POZ domain and ankyrin repeat-containing protein NPR1-like isoform X2 [Tripterygium wilfordii]KAF5744049.1 regulatory protein NPR3-like [Tripterygium wilfordii]
MVRMLIMESGDKISSSLSFASSSYASNGCSGHNLSAPSSSEPGANLENVSLSKLSGSLERLLLDAEYDYTDAEIVVEGVPKGVHQCILAARSHFFHELFRKGNDGSKEEGKPRYLMSDLVPHGRVGFEAFNVFLHYIYTGKLNPSSPEVSTCVDDYCVHDACLPAINYALELMYASATFQVKELVLLVQRYLLNFIEKALPEDIIPIVIAAFHCQLNLLLSQCIQRIVRSDLDNICLEKELPHEVFDEIKSLRKSLEDPASIVPEVDPVHEKRIRRIHRALDSYDIPLLKLLLDESYVSLDDAYALHYAAAYSDPKVFKEVLALGQAGVNIRNSRGQTVLHVAARRKEPSVLLALLSNGACASEATLDGQTAVAICRRLTRPKDYNEGMKRCKESNRDRLCIDLLERELRRDSMSGNMSTSSSEVIADDLQMRLDYLENRVAFARLFFPTEARLATESAVADSTPVYTGLLASKSKGSSGNLREVDLNEIPSMRTKRLQMRMQALRKTDKFITTLLWEKKYSTMSPQ